MKWLLIWLLGLVISLCSLVVPAGAQTFEADIARAATKIYTDGDYAGAVVDLDAMVIAYPNTPRVHFELGWAKSYLEDHTAAISNMIINRDSAEPYEPQRTRIVLLTSYLQTADTANALATAKEAVEFDGYLDRKQWLAITLKTIADNGTQAEIDAAVATILNHSVSVSESTLVAGVLTDILVVSRDDILNMALPLEKFTTRLKKYYISLGRANDPAMAAAITQLTEGGAARPLSTSARMSAIGLTLDDSTAAGKFWQLFLAGSYQLAGQHAWVQAKAGSDTDEFKWWIEMTILARKAEQQHFNDTLALDFAKWQNADPDVPTNPLAAWLGE